MHILRLAAVLLLAWSVSSCRRSLAEDLPELSVSIHIPDMSGTKAETGSVGPTESEKRFTSLQLWVFLHTDGDNDGQLVGYKGFVAGQLVNTGLTHEATTRFGIPLRQEMFQLLSQGDTKVDVYAVANVSSVVSESLGDWTSRSQLENIVLSGSRFGTSPMTMTVPSAGLPMSGMLKETSVTGGYPTLNVSTVTLTRAVSKIRFVFCQQGTPATGENPATPSNATCVVKSIAFGGTAEDHDCQIAASEKLFTAQTYPGTNNLFDINGYTPLSTILAGTGEEPLVKNTDISVSEYPDALLFRSRGHETETAREYESRLDAAVGSPSQVGPIYIRETDKLISGTIVYNTGEEDLTATFSMEADDDNILSRNHSWILYAYFAEATKTLEFKVVVLPWDKETYNYSFEAQTVNVVRRFTIPESYKFKKKKAKDGYHDYDIYFWHTLADQPNIVKGDIIVATPVGQKIHVVPVAGAPEGRTPLEGIFSVSPMVATIYPDGTTTEDCKIEYEIQCNPGTYSAEELEGNYIDLHFCVEIGNNERWIDLDSESIDYYRIILKQDWEHGGE